MGRLSLSIHIGRQPGPELFSLERNLSEPRLTFPYFRVGLSHLSTDRHIIQYAGDFFSPTSFNSCRLKHSKTCSEDLQRAILNDTLSVVILMK